MDHGSSPPARGTLRHQAAHTILPASIGSSPARAGNTIPTCQPSPGRARRFIPARAGEHFAAARAMSFRGVLGSSPPARGTLYPYGVFVPGNRFIPARAGNTFPHWAEPMTTTVHPRPRGEHILMTLCASLSAGSSPPARGTHFAMPSRSGSMAGSSPPARGTLRICHAH